MATFNRIVLSGILSRVGDVFGGSPLHPLWDTVVINVTDGEGVIWSTSYESEVRCPVRCQGDFSGIVSGKVLKKMVDLCAGETITIERDHTNAIVSSGKYQAKLPVLSDPADLVSLKPADVRSYLKVDGKELSRAIKCATRFCHKDLHFNPTGMKISAESEQVIVEATDGHRYLRVVVPGNGNVTDETAEVIVSPNLLKPLLNLSGPVIVSVGSPLCIETPPDKKSDEAVFIFRTLDRKYPDGYQLILDRRTDESDGFTVDRQDFINSLKRVSVLSKTDPVTISYYCAPQTAGHIELTVMSSEGGIAMDKMDAQTVGTGSAMFDSSQLLDCLNSLECEQASFEVRGDRSPVIFEERRMLGALMPLVREE